MSETLQGVVERVTFYNEDSSWGVIKIMPESLYPDAQASDGTIAVVGVMPELVEGETAKFTGKWVDNPQYGRQFKAQTAIPIGPTNKEGVIRYLMDNVHGVGEATAKKIVAYLGDDILEKLDDNPEQVRKVPKLKASVAANVIEEWTTGRAKRQIMIYLQSFGVTNYLANRIYKEYGSEALQLAKTNPYRLADELHGIGFKRADVLARGIGIKPDAPERLRAGLRYTLEQIAKNGHTYAPETVLLARASELLDLSPAHDVLLKQVLHEETQEQSVIHQQLHHADEVVDAIYLPMYYHSERGVARLLHEIAKHPSQVRFRMMPTEWEPYLRELAKDNDVHLSQQQQQAVKAAMTSKVSVLTGGPGTGKTTTLQMAIHALEAEGFDYALASPTGRAAKRLGEATGRDASTIHRLLGWNPQARQFEHDEYNPLDIHMLIIDESSMIDLILFYNVLKALPPHAHLMLVGDIDQLPSVGAGNVLNDVIQSGVAHVTRLNQIFRQSERSHITLNAHRINKGEMPFTDNKSDDFFFFALSEPQAAADMVVDLVAKRINDRFPESQYHPLTDMQVIAPMYRGPIGVNALNEALQQRLNGSPHIAHKRMGSKTFRKNDKVMQTKNNYDKDVFNGDIGFVHSFDEDEGTMRVTVDGRWIEYKFDDAEEQLIHAYCISTHRSQGSEYPVVVMPVMTQHYMMLQRNLIYTAITRAKKLCVLVGNRRALGIAVKNNEVAERYSGLLARLQTHL